MAPPVAKENRKSPDVTKPISFREEVTPNVNGRFLSSLIFLFFFRLRFFFANFVASFLQEQTTINLNRNKTTKNV